MTERVNPSFDRPVDAFKTAGAISQAGGSGEGWVYDGASQISVQDGNITEANLNTFAETSSASSFDVTIDGGEAYVFGSWLAIDTATTVSLSGSTANQTVYVGWDKNAADGVIVGTDSAFSAAAGDTDQRIGLWEFDTDGSGVTSVTDLREIGYSQTIGGKQYFGENEDFSAFYDSSSDTLTVLDEANGVTSVTLSKNGGLTVPSGRVKAQSGLTVSGQDVLDGSGNVIYSTSSSHVPLTILEEDTVSVAGNSVTLGNSTTVDYTDLNDTGTSFPIPNSDLSNNTITVAGNSVSLGGASGIAYTELSDTSTSFPIVNNDLNNSSVSVVAGSQLSGGGTVDLGGSITIDLVNDANLDSLTLTDQNNDGDTWSIEDDATNGNFAISDSTTGTVTDIDSDGNIRTEGELTEGSAL